MPHNATHNNRYRDVCGGFKKKFFVVVVFAFVDRDFRQIILTDILHACVQYCVVYCPVKQHTGGKFLETVEVASLADT